MTTKKILVTVAMGHQGRVLIRALNGPEAFHFLALTRAPNSPAAQRLASEHLGLVTLVQGDLSSGEGSLGNLGRGLRPRVPRLGANADGEEMQGKERTEVLSRAETPANEATCIQPMADIALEYGMSTFVFSSAERGSEYCDDQTQLDTRAKVMIEQHIREPGEKGLPWTFLRPGFFMENYEGFLESITVGVPKNGLKPPRLIAWLACRCCDFQDMHPSHEDYSHFKALQNPAKYAAQILIVSGKVATMAQQEESYKKAIAQRLPSIPGFLARELITLNAHTKELLADLERKHDAREAGKCPKVVAQTAAAGEAYPEMQTFQACVECRRERAPE
ncbi:NAD(P)-binding protein [Mycena vulgaris]|nr:NAD(P)-binding protein [Mycena vulgaris]